MSLKLMYITNHPEIAVIAQRHGVDRIWVDLETLGKEIRQKNIDSIRSHHSVDDIRVLRPLLSASELQVRVNPWNKTSEYEINAAVDYGADIIVFPMWKTVKEVESFLHVVGKRTKTMLLMETKEAVECLDDILKLEFDEIYIGLNDLHLSYGMSFLFEPLALGIVGQLCAVFHERGLVYGFGGIGRLGCGRLDPRKIIPEHYRLGSVRVSLSKSFFSFDGKLDVEKADTYFRQYVGEIREFERQAAQMTAEEYANNHKELFHCVQEITCDISRLST